MPDKQQGTLSRLTSSPSYGFDLPEACPWSLCHHGCCCSGGSSLVCPCAGCSSFMATNSPHRALFRWLRCPTLTINKRMYLLSVGCITCLYLCINLELCWICTPITKFKQCLRLPYNPQLIKPQNKWLELFNIFINFSPLIIFSIKSFIKTCHWNSAICSIFIKSTWNIQLSHSLLSVKVVTTNWHLFYHAVCASVNFISHGDCPYLPHWGYL